MPFFNLNFNNCDLFWYILAVKLVGNSETTFLYLEGQGTFDSYFLICQEVFMSEFSLTYDAYRRLPNRNYLYTS